jgi:hypothetical protein
MPQKRILLVEDDEDVGEVLRIALLEDGYVVDLAMTVAEVLAIPCRASVCAGALGLAPAGRGRVGHRGWRRRVGRQDLHHERLSAGDAGREARRASMHDEADPRRRPAFPDPQHDRRATRTPISGRCESIFRKKNQQALPRSVCKLVDN